MALFLTIVYFAGGLVTRVETVEKVMEQYREPVSSIPVLSNQITGMSKQLDRLENKMDLILLQQKKADK